MGPPKKNLKRELTFTKRMLGRTKTVSKIPPRQYADLIVFTILQSKLGLLSNSNVVPEEVAPGPRDVTFSELISTEKDEVLTVINIPMAY